MMLVIILAVIVLATVLTLRRKKSSQVTITPTMPRTASLSALVTIAGMVRAAHLPGGFARANSTTIYANAYETEFRTLEDRLRVMGF